MSLREEISKIGLKDPVAVIRLITARYPEMTWLTGSVAASPEASHTLQTRKTIGETIFPDLDPAALIEFNRTAIGILTFLWAYYSDYDAFTACQSGPDKMSKELFGDLTEFTLSIANSDESFEAIIVYMVINDLGKIQSVVDQIVKLHGVIDVDHDKLLRRGLEADPTISPSFSGLTRKYRNLILEGMAADFNLGQFIQAENVPASLVGVQKVSNMALDLFLLHSLFDIAGAAGQSVQNGSVVMTESTYENFKRAIDILGLLHLRIIASQTYIFYILERADILQLNRPQDGMRSKWALTRIACMIRLITPDEGTILRETFQELPDTVRSILVKELTISGEEDEYATLIYYAPAIMLNFLKKMKASENPEAYKRALTLGLTTLARVYQEARIALKDRKGPGVFTVMALNLANLARDYSDAIYSTQISLKQVGNDAEIVLTPAASGVPVGG